MVILLGGLDHAVVATASQEAALFDAEHIGYMGIWACMYWVYGYGYVAEHWVYGYQCPPKK